MSTSPVRDQQTWEYRRLFAIPHRHQPQRKDWKWDDAGFVENLAETIECLERARKEGWKLLSVKIEEDDHGRCWLNAYMKWQKSDDDGKTARQHALQMPSRTILSNTTFEVDDKPLPHLGIEKAA